MTTTTEIVKKLVEQTKELTELVNSLIKFVAPEPEKPEPKIPVSPAMAVRMEYRGHCGILEGDFHCPNCQVLHTLWVSNDFIRLKLPTTSEEGTVWRSDISRALVCENCRKTLNYWVVDPVIGIEHPPAFVKSKK